MKTLLNPVFAVGALLLAGTASQGGTLSFNGNNSYVQVGPAPQLQMTGSNLTLEAWIKPRGPGSDATLGGVIFGREGEYMLARNTNGNVQYAFATTGHPFRFEDSGYGAPANQWAHVAVTYDGSFFRLYTNGVAVDAYPTTGPIGDTFPAENDFRIGGRQHQGQYFQGESDEVRVWNVTRTAAEIVANMRQQLRGDEPGLVAYYRLDERFGTTADDATGHGLTGTLVNNPLWNTAADALSVPVAVSQPATSVTETSANLNASLNLDGGGVTNSFWLATNASTALAFDGVDDQVWFPHDANQNAYPLTVTAWVKTAAPGANGGLVNKYVSGSLNGWQIRLLNGQVRAWYFRNNANYVHVPNDGLNGGNVDDGQWHHVAFTVGTNGGRLYVDGLLRVTNAWTGTPGASTTTQVLRFGAHDTYFPGQMDEVTLWQTNLSAEAIAGLMTTPPTPAHPQYPNLLGHWNLDEGSGGFVADSTGRSPLGLLQGHTRWIPQARPVGYVTTSPTLVGGTNAVLGLDGQGAYVKVPAGIWFSNEFTIESWVYERSYNNGSRILDFGNGAPSDNVLFALSQGTTGVPLFARFSGATGPQSLAAPAPIPLNQWVHLAATLRTNTATLYVNGVPVASGAMTAPNTVMRNNNYIGRSGWSTDAYANALYDDLRIWNSARTPDEIRQFMHQPVRMDDTNLVLNYRFDEPSGPTAVDSRSTSPQNGTLTNGASRLPFERTGTSVAGLTPGTSYHFRSVAANSNGVSASRTENFATLTPGVGTALEFDGKADYVQVGPQPRLKLTGTNLTLEAWIKPTGPGSDATYGGGVLCKEGEYMIERQPNGTLVYAIAASSPGWVAVVTPCVAPPNQWTHITLNYDGARFRFFTNGVLGHTNIASGTIGDGDPARNDFRMGVREAAGRYFQGQIEEVRVWNVTRTTDQIFQSMNSRLAGTETGLLAYYRLDEGAGLVARDATANGLDGLLLNEPAWVPSTAPVGWPLVMDSDVTQVVLGDATGQATVKGDGASATRVWFEYGNSYTVVPDSAENAVFFLTTATTVTSLDQVNFNAVPAYVQSFANIAINPTTGTLWPGGPTNYFAARYTGRLFLPANGLYTFSTESDDGSRLYVNGERVVDNDGVHTNQLRSGTISLPAGHHNFEVQMFDRTNVASLIVSYAGPGISNQVIPPEAFLSHQRVYDGRTAVQTNASDAAQQILSDMATNLLPGTPMFFRAVAANDNGTNYGAVQSFVMGNPGGFTALCFDGVDDYIEILNSTNRLSFPGRSEFTLEAWIKPARHGKAQMIVSKSDDYQYPTRIEYYLGVGANGRIAFERQVPAVALWSSSVVPLNQWTHVAATYDGMRKRIYINGVLDATDVGDSNPSASRAIPVLIGALFTAGLPSTFFEGTIDEVRIWQVARSRLQIDEDKNRRLTGYELGLAAYWHFDEGEGSLAWDSTVEGFDGWQVNGPVYVPSEAPLLCANVAPALNIEMLDFTDGVLLWWPITCNEYVLEEAYEMPVLPGGWYPVREPITPIDDTYVVVLLRDWWQNYFFRLRRL